MSERITSIQNQRVKDAAKLRDHRARRKQGRVIIDGIRELRKALAAKLDWTEVYFCDDEAASPEATKLALEFSAAGVPVLKVSPPVFEKLAFGHRAEGVVGIAREPERTLADLRLPACPLVAVLEGVEKPGNVGAVLRTADAAGISAVIIANGGTDLFNPNTIRASLGAIFSVQLATAESEQVLDWLRERGLAIFAARVDGSYPYTKADFRPAAALVLGSEADGLSAVWRAEDISAISLPMHGQIDSLNVSATAAVLFYEAVRQRSEAAPT